MLFFGEYIFASKRKSQEERNADGDTDIRSLSTVAPGSVLIDQQIGIGIMLMDSLLLKKGNKSG